MTAPAHGPQAPGIGIAAGAHWLPAERRSLHDWARVRGRAGMALLPAMQANGLAHYHVAPRMSVQDLALAAVGRLLEQSGRPAAEVDLIVYCHTNNTSTMAAPASVPAEVARRFGMHRAAGWSVAQQNCASIVCALRLLRSLLWRHPEWNNVLVVSADKVHAERFRNVSTYAIQSDGGLALWLTRDHGLNRIGQIAYAVDSRYYEGAAKPAELAQRYALNYPVLAHQMMLRVMQQSGWSAADVDAVLPMNANLGAFSRVMEMLGMPRERLHTANIGAVGHVFCCDPFINFLERFAQPALVRSGNAILFASASSGVFCALGITRAWTGQAAASPWAEAPAPLACGQPDGPVAQHAPTLPRTLTIGDHA